MPLTKQITCMQMLTTKLIFFWLLISITSTCNAETVFLEHFQISPQIDSKLANRITSYHAENISLGLIQKKTELEKLSQQLENIENQYNNKAVYWFIKGLHSKNLASHYLEAGDKGSFKKQLSNKNQYYKKSMALAKQAPEQLSSSIYSAIKHGLEKEFKIQAIQSELALGGSGESDSHYWYLHWSNIDQLKKIGRHKEAEKAYSNMQKELKTSGQDLSVYNKLSTQIEKTTLKTREQTAAVPVKQVRKEVKKKKDKPIDNKKIVIIVTISLAVLSLLIVTMYELVLKKRKSR